MNRSFFPFVISLMAIMIIFGSPVSASTADEWYYQGNKMYNLEEYEKAIEAYDEAIKIDSNSVNAWYNKGDALLMLGYSDESEGGLTSILALFHRNRYEEAVEAYDKVIEINPKSADAWISKSAALYRLGRAEEAEKASQNAREIDQDIQVRGAAFMIWLVSVGEAIEENNNY